MEPQQLPTSSAKSFQKIMCERELMLHHSAGCFVISQFKDFSLSTSKWNAVIKISWNMIQAFDNFSYCVTGIDCQKVCWPFSTLFHMLYMVVWYLQNIKAANIATLPMLQSEDWLIHICSVSQILLLYLQEFISINSLISITFLYYIHAQNTRSINDNSPETHSGISSW